jgi:hypothetical protein
MGRVPGVKTDRFSGLSSIEDEFEFEFEDDFSGTRKTLS